MLQTKLLMVSLAVVFAVAATPSWGQSPYTTESILKYLEQDLAIQPAVGFKNVRLGYSFDAVAKVWGKPYKVEQFPLFGITKKWLYKAGSTTIVLVGSKVVESIEVIGDFNSPFQTTEGIRFGTSPHQIIAVYGRPDKAKGLTLLVYTRRGIEFAMQNGNLKALRVFPAGRR